MKRRWQIGWMLLASLLITAAAWLFIAWPKAPRWRIDLALPVGFDLDQRLLWTLPEKQDDECQLIGYDLDTGRKRIAYPIPFDMPQSGSDTYLHGILSADNKILACFDNSTSIQTFDLQNQCQRLGKIPEDSTLYSIAFSKNGETLALLKNLNRIEIRETRTGELKKMLKMPDALPTGKSGFGRFISDPSLMQFSDDGQFIAATSRYDKIYVFDLNNDRLLGICENANYPLFLSNNVLVAIPNLYFDSDKLQQWYQIDKGSIKQLPLARHFDSKDDLRGIACNSNYTCYFKWVKRAFPALPKWIPASLRNKLEVALGKNDIHYDVLLVDANTGKLVYEFPFRVEKHLPDLGYYSTMIAPDGSLLVLREETELSLWDIPPRRSLNCWIVCSGIALVALWLAWPRRVKAPKP